MADERAGAILWQGKWLIAVSLVFSIAVAVLATELQTKVYAASALVQAPGAPAARTYAALIGERGFLAKIRRQVEDGRYTAGELANRIGARAVGGTALVRVTAEESSPALAVALARDVATAFMASTQGVALAAPASATGSAIRPKTLQNVLAGVALGLLLGVVLSWLRVRLDRALRGEEEVRELAGAEVLAAIPLRRRLLPDDPLLEDAFDALFARLDGSPRVVTITSAGRGEGRTAAAVGLAKAAVRAGVRVLLIDGDVRNPGLSAQFGARELPGLANVAAAHEWLDEAVLETEPGLSVLPAGPAPAETSALLASGRAREIVADARERHRLVVVDAPALATGPDASVLAAVSDAVLLVARVGVTGGADLGAAAAAVRETGAQLAGVAVYRPQARDDLARAAPADARAPGYDSLVRD